MGHKKEITIVMGPTGSGKSAIALEIASRAPTVIINADAMQMVDTLRVLTARPTAEEEQQAEHALYGVLRPHEPTSVACWLAQVEPVIRRAWDEGKQPLLVGGTGMYIKALMEGLAAIPLIPEALRQQLRMAYPDAADGRLHAALAARDPVMAARLKSGDTQRLLRALEVVEATGQSLDFWQSQAARPLFPDTLYRPCMLLPEREVLYPRLNARFDAMLEAGALAEVAALMARNLPPDTPILRAHGVPELAAHLRGEMTRAAASSQAKQHTRNYAKRQMTWLRQQMPNATVLDPALPHLDEIFTEL